MIKYRPEVDGLRALAVLPVIFFHAGFTPFAGGYVGVDIFFVISGYLITTIMLREMDAGRFSLIHFYERRARRILPAIFFVMAVSSVLGWLVMSPGQLQSFGQSLVAVAVYASNILFWITRDYFAPAAEEVPLLHTWSLGIEEQFYLIVPLLLMLCWRGGRQLILLMISLIIVASFAVSDWSSTVMPSTNFYLLHTRAWELMAGSLVAFLLYYVWVGERDYCQWPTALRNSLSIAGIVMIGVAMFTYSATTPFPGRYALLPVVGTMLIIVTATPGTWLFKWLSFKPVVFVGLLSYSAYLWHQPLFAFARVTNFGHLTSVMAWLLTGLTLILAWATWRWIEAPFRDKRQISRGLIFSGAAACSVLFIVLGLYLHKSNGAPQRFDEHVNEVAATAQSSPYRSQCHVLNALRRGPDQACTVTVTADVGSTAVDDGQGSDQLATSHSDAGAISGPDIRATYAVLGDSHGVELAYALAEVLADSRGPEQSSGGYSLNSVKRADGVNQLNGVKQMTLSQCEMISGTVYPRYAHCELWYRQASTLLANDNEVETVVIAGRYVQLKGNNAVRDDYAGLLREIVAELRAAGKNVKLVMPVPEFRYGVVDAWYQLQSVDGMTALHSSVTEYQSFNQGIRQLLTTIASEYGASIVDPKDAFCQRTVCLPLHDDQLLYYDAHHLSVAGARLLINRQLVQFNLVEGTP